MRNSNQRFQIGIRAAKELNGLYDYLQTALRVPSSFDDLLRSQIVYAVSALDKLMHDLVRVGMLQTFLGIRPPTPKYRSETMSFEVYHNLTSTSVPPPEYWIEREIVQKHKNLSFQQPERIADALSLIWLETHKWQEISTVLGMREELVRTTLITIVDRRNKIVHEGDFDPYSGTKYTITQTEANNAVQFIESLGTAIYNLVRSPETETRINS